MSAPLAVSAIKTNRTNIIGEGLRLKSQVDADFLGLTPEQASVWQRTAEREFKLWAGSKFCDSTRTCNFYEIQQVACMSWLMNGDACILLEYEKPSRNFPYGLRIHLVESDRVSTPHTTGNNVYLYATNPDNGNRIFNGVEVDKNNRVVAYHICNTYPNSNLYAKKEWKRVKAFGDRTGAPGVLMIYETERAEQYRGVPYLAPVIESLKQLTRYSEAEMMAALINGIFTAFVTSDKGTSELGFTGIVDEDSRVSDDDADYELGNGLVQMLAPGEKIEIADAKRPAQNFDAFVASLAKYIGAALEVPAEVLMKSFMSSYSASRAALLEAWKAFRMKRAWIAADFCQPVYELFLSEAIAKGRLHAPGFFLDPLIHAAYCGAQWNGPSQGMVDPVKEVSAAEKRIQIGISTRQRETTELLGGDFERNVAQLAREKQIMKDAGLLPGAAPSGESDAGGEKIKESEEETDAEGAGKGGEDESDGGAGGEDAAESGGE